MIVLDIETRGTDFYKSGIWQIGALEFENPQNTFLEEARIDNEDQIVNIPGDKRTVYEITGLKDEDFRDKRKQSQKKLIQNFFNYVKNLKAIKNCICQNPAFDLGIINIKAGKYGLGKIPFHHRSFDLHTYAQEKYKEIHGKFLIKDDHSDMGLSNILEFCGMKDNRKKHNALEDCKLTAECFSRLVHGKPLFPEYSQFKVPAYLAK